MIFVFFCAIDKHKTNKWSFDFRFANDDVFNLKELPHKIIIKTRRKINFTIFENVFQLNLSRSYIFLMVLFRDDTGEKLPSFLWLKMEQFKM